MWRTNLVSILVSILISSLLAAGGDRQASADSAVSQPNIVLILVDDMGFGDPTCYNRDSKIPTPQIDSLARDGMRFTDAHAPGPLCHMSRYGLLTGRYPFRTNVSLWSTHPLIEDGQMTLASLLGSQGYCTAMVGKWHLGFQEEGYDKPLHGGPVDRGFASFFGICASTDIPPYFYIRGDRAVAPPTGQIEASSSPDWSPIQGAFWRAGGIAPGLELSAVLPRFTDEAIQILESHVATNTGASITQPLFLYLALPAPHTPWLPSPEYRGQSKAGMYGDFVVMVDAMIGRILKSLDRLNMADDTLVIFTSDNGPVWYAADVQRFDHDASGGLRGMKADAWEAGHRMPFIVRWPEKIPAGATSHQLICFTDLLATFASLIDVDLPDGAGPDSFDFSPALLAAQPDSVSIRKSLVLNSGNGTMIVREGNWKLITGLGSGGFSQPARAEPLADGPRGQLFNLGNDLGEITNLYQAQPDVVLRLTGILERVQGSQRSREPAS